MDDSECRCRYEMYRHRCVSEHSGNYFSYGIRVTSSEGCDLPASRCEISDVHTDSDVVRALVLLCNSLELEPCHLMDVIEDWLP